MIKKVKVVPYDKGWLEQFNGYSGQNWTANKIYELDESDYKKLSGDAYDYNHGVAMGPAIEVVDVK